MAPFNAGSMIDRMQKSANRSLWSRLSYTRGTVRKWSLLLTWACMIAAISYPAHAEGEPTEYQVKAAFLLNFTKFVQWPVTAFSDEHSPLTICILGDDPFGNTLNDTVKGEAVNGHELSIQRIRRAPDPKSCQVLFVARPEKEVPKILSDLGPGILTVGEGEKFLRDGGIVAFVIQDRRVRFDISQTAASRARLTLSSRLMNVARSVEK
jgi:YfiR/HmsC-like